MASYIGKVPTAVPLTSSDITDGIVSNAKLAQDVISAETALTSAPADTDEFLLSDAGTLKRIDYSLIKAEAGLTKLAETTISSNTASISFDGYFSSTYDIYQVYFTNLKIVGTGNYVTSIRFRRSNADVTSSNYRSAVQQAYGASPNGGENVNGDFPSSLINMVKDSSVKGNNDFGISGQITFYNPLGTSAYKMVNGQTAYQYSTDRFYTGQFSGTLVDATTALSGFTFLNSGGENFNGGTVYLFGVKT